MTPAPQPHKCKTCSVRWKSCGLKPKDCPKPYHLISDAEIELILQTNENLPSDELELPVRDMLVMEVRERGPRPIAPAPILKAFHFERDGLHFTPNVGCEQIISLAEHDALIAQQAIAGLKKKPGCYIDCPFDDLCSNDIEKIKEIEQQAAKDEREKVLDTIIKTFTTEGTLCVHPESEDCLHPEGDCIRCYVKYFESLRSTSTNQSDEQQPKGDIKK